MRQGGVVPNKVTFSALISASNKGKQLQQALEVFQIMKRCVVPNVVTHSALISTCEKGKHLRQWQAARAGHEAL